MGRRDRMLSEKQGKKKLGRPRTANWLSGGSSAASQSSCQGFRSSSGVLLRPLTHRVYQAHVFPSQIWLHLGLKGCIMPRQTPAPACKWDIHEEKEKKKLKKWKALISKADQIWDLKILSRVEMGNQLWLLSCPTEDVNNGQRAKAGDAR